MDAIHKILTFLLGCVAGFLAGQCSDNIIDLSDEKETTVTYDTVTTYYPEFIDIPVNKESQSDTITKVEYETKRDTVIEEVDCQSLSPITIHKDTIKDSLYQFRYDIGIQGRLLHKEFSVKPSISQVTKTETIIQPNYRHAIQSGPSLFIDKEGQLSPGLEVGYLNKQGIGLSYARSTSGQSYFSVNFRLLSL